MRAFNRKSTFSKKIFREKKFKSNYTSEYIIFLAIIFIIINILLYICISKDFKVNTIILLLLKINFYYCIYIYMDLLNILYKLSLCVRKKKISNSL